MNAAAGAHEQFTDWEVDGADIMEIRDLMMTVLFAAVRQRLFPKNSPKMEKTDRPSL